MALSDKQISKMWSDAHNDTSDRMAYQVLAKAVEAEARRDALEEAAAAVEKATYSKRWAKAAVNSHPDYVPPCEFAALIRAMKEPTP